MSRSRPTRLVLAALLLAPAGAHAATARLTQDAVDQSWGPASRVVSGVNVLVGGGDNVYFHDGTELVTVQAKGDLGTLRTQTLQLATGSEPDSWIGAWGRDDSAFVWTYRAGSPVDPPVEAIIDNPLQPGTAMIPLDMQVADGCAFGRFAAPSDPGQAFLFAIDAQDGSSTVLNVEGTGDGVRELAADGCKAAFVFDTGRRVSLRLFDGDSSAEIDVGDISQVVFRGGRLLYVKKTLDGASDVWLYDTTEAAPSPARISIDGRSSHPATDGTYVVWLRHNVDGTFDLLTRGNIPLVTYDRRPADPDSLDELGVQVDSGQLLWRDRAGRYQYDDGTGVKELALGNIRRPVLQGGRIAYLGTLPRESDGEVFLFDATPPYMGSDLPPPLRVMATAGDQTFQLEWSPVIGADSYTVYIAEEPGVTREDYRRRYRGQKLDDKQSGVRVNDLLIDGMRKSLENQRTYYVTVSARRGTSVGPSSREIDVTPGRPFELVPEIGQAPQHAAASQKLNPLIAFSGGGVDCDGPDEVPTCAAHRSMDRATTFSKVTGNYGSMDPRAIYIGGQDVVLVSAGVNGRDVIHQSANEGLAWNPQLDAPARGKRKGIDQWVQREGYITFIAGVWPDGTQGGMTFAAGAEGVWGPVQALAPPAPGVDAWGVKVRGSTDAADIWWWGGGSTQLLRLTVTADGSSWACSNPACAEQLAAPPGSGITALHIDEERIPRTYAATDRGMFRSDDAWATWLPINEGLPEQPPPVINDILVFDEGNLTKYYHEVVLIATDHGLFRTVDAGKHWSPHNLGLPDPAPEIFDIAWVGNDFGEQNMLLATEDGLYRTPWVMPEPHAADLFLEYHCSPGELDDPQYRPAKVGEEVGCEAFVQNAGPASARDLQLDLTFEGAYFDLKPDSFRIEQGYCEGWPAVKCYVSRLENKGSLAFGLTVIPRVSTYDAGKDFYIMGAGLRSLTSRDPLSDDNGFNIKLFVEETVGQGGSGGTTGGGGTGGTGGIGAGGHGGTGAAGSGGTTGGGGTVPGSGGGGGFGGGGPIVTRTPEGCQCQSGGSPAEVLLLALGLALALRRRRR